MLLLQAAIRVPSPWPLPMQGVCGRIALEPVTGKAWISASAEPPGALLLTWPGPAAIRGEGRSHCQAMHAAACPSRAGASKVARPQRATEVFGLGWVGSSCQAAADGMCAAE